VAEEPTSRNRDEGHPDLWRVRRFTLVGMSEEVLARTVCQSQSERSEIIFPADANALGNLFGGRLMQYIDLVGAMAAKSVGPTLSPPRPSQPTIRNAMITHTVLTNFW